MENKNEEKKLFEPETEEIKISSNKDDKFYIFLSKIVLKKFGKVKLTSLGRISERVVKISEKLIKDNYVVMANISSSMKEVDNNGRSKEVIRFEVELKKSNKFDEMIKDQLK